MTENKTNPTEDFSIIENFVSALNIEVEEVKKSNIYKKVLEILPDAELIDVKKIDKESND